MAQLLPFCGWRFDLSQVGSLNDVTAPPTVDIDQDLQDSLYRRHPCNVVRLARNRDEPGDTSSADRVTRADDFLKLWKNEGVLFREHDDCFYVCETCAPPGTSTSVDTGDCHEPASRISIIARLAIPRAGSDEIRSVGAVCDKAVQTELEFLRQCRTTLAPVSGLVSLEDSGQSESLSQQLRTAVAGLTPIEILNDSGVRHRIWPLARHSVSSGLYTQLSHARVLLTGSTAIFAAALLFRDEYELRTGTSIPDEGACLNLAALVPDDDPGLRFAFPVWGLPQISGRTTAAVVSVLEENFECQHVGSESFAAKDAVELAALNSRQPCLALGTADGAWLIISRRCHSESAQESPLISRRRLAEDIGQAFGIVATAMPTSTVLDPLAANQNDAAPDRVVALISPATTSQDLRDLADRELPQVLHIQTRLADPIPTGLVFSMPD